MQYLTKRRGKSKNNYILYSFLIFLSLYTDTMMRGPLGNLGNTFIPIFIVPIFAYLYLTHKLKTCPFAEKYLYLIIYTFAISIISIIVFIFLDINLVQKGNSVLTKTFNISITMFTEYAYVRVLVSLARKLRFKQLFLPFVYSFFLLTVILVLEYIQLPDAFPWLHYSECPYYRIRLLTSEASWTSLMLEITGIVTFYYAIYVNKSKKLVASAAICVVLHLVLSGSKTFLVAMGLIVIVVYWNNIKKMWETPRQFIIMMFLLCCAILGFALMIPSLIASFTSDIEEFSSTVTRFYSIGCGFILGLKYPLGTGFGAYLYLLPECMKNNLSLVGEYNISEIVSYIESKDAVAVTAKSFIGQNSIYWGIIGSLYFLRFFYKEFVNAFEKSRLTGRKVFMGLALILMVQLVFSSGMEFILLALVSLMSSLSKRKKIIYKHENNMVVTGNAFTGKYRWKNRFSETHRISK